MQFRTFAVILPIASLVAGLALAEDPKPQAGAAAGNEIVETGSFECTAGAGEGNTKWTCPAQAFNSKFAQAPVVNFSVAGFSKVAMPGDGGLSIAVGTTGEITQQGFTPALDTTLGQAAGADQSTVRIGWIAAGPGERVQKVRQKKRDR